MREETQMIVGAALAAELEWGVAQIVESYVLYQQTISQAKEEWHDEGNSH
jgi:hypothetical protein